LAIGFSILLIAAGACLIWAVHQHVSGVDLHLLGFILLIVGAFGLLASLLVFGGRRRGGPALRR
jgi:hypothetical protein